MQKIKEILAGKLYDFFACEFDENNPVMLFLIDSIYENIPIDANKFAFALESLSNLTANNDSLSFRSQNNVFNVSLDGFEEVFFKAFHAKGEPIIYFYRGSETQPFFKIKTEKNNENVRFVVETSSDSDLLSKFKSRRLLSVDKSSYVVLNDFLATPDGCYSVKYLSACSKFHDDAFSYDIKNYPSEYSRFFDFICKNIKGTSIDLRTLNSEALFANFYDVIKKSTSGENEFSFIDVISIIDNVLSNNEIVPEESSGDRLISAYVPDICKMENHHGNLPKRRYVEIKDPDLNVKKIEIVKSEQYLSMDMIDEAGKRICSYIVCATNKGFTLFRNIADSNFVSNPNYPATFTFNMTENEIKFTSISGNEQLAKVKNPIEMTLGIYNGFVQLEQEERGFYPSKSLPVLETAEVEQQFIIVK